MSRWTIDALGWGAARPLESPICARCHGWLLVVERSAFALARFGALLLALTLFSVGVASAKDLEPGDSALGQPGAGNIPLVERTAQVDRASVTGPADAPSGSGLRLTPVPDDYSHYDGDWITIDYHPSLSGKVRLLKQSASTLRDDLRALLGEEVLDQVQVRVGRTPFEMEKLAPRGGAFPKYASGVAYSSLDLMLLTAEARYPGQNHDLVEIFAHELVHLALHDAVGRENIPRWFNEGLAVHASGEAEVDRVQTLWTATLADNLLPLAKLSRGFPQDSTEASIAYAQSADLVRFLLRGGEEHRFRSLIERIADGQSFEAALRDAYATDLASLEHDWRQDVARRYSFWPILLGGSTIWVAAIVLFVWGYVRRKRRAQKKLDRWAREEAAEDARRELAQALLNKASAVRVVVGHPSAEAGEEEESSRPLAGVPQVPKVQHDGDWHTLH